MAEQRTRKAIEAELNRNGSTLAGDTSGRILLELLLDIRDSLNEIKAYYKPKDFNEVGPASNQSSATSIGG